MGELVAHVFDVLKTGGDRLRDHAKLNQVFPGGARTSHGRVGALNLRESSICQLLHVGDQDVELALDHGYLVALAWVRGLRGRLYRGNVGVWSQVLDSGEQLLASKGDPLEDVVEPFLALGGSASLHQAPSLERASATAR